MPEKLRSIITVEQPKIVPVKLDPGELGARLIVHLTDSKGNKSKVLDRKAESFVRQFIELLRMQFLRQQSFDATNSYGTGMIAPIGYVKDITGVEQFVLKFYNMNLALNAASGDDTLGSYVGTGTTIPTIDDYAPETKIANGTSAGQLQYSAVSFGKPSTDGSTSQFSITRDFANNSGGSIDVTEIGLLCKSGLDTQTIQNTYQFLILRDTVTAIAVPTGQTLTISYQIQAVV